jgi:hypothetical protein
MERAAANVRRNQLLKLLCTTPKNVLAIQWENVGRQKKTKKQRHARADSSGPNKKKKNNGERLAPRTRKRIKKSIGVDQPT